MVSCQAVLEDNSYTHFVSLIIYNLWNHSKCFVGNVYIPIKKHSLQVRYSEVFTWLQNHINHLSILLGEFSMSTTDLQNKSTVTLATGLFFQLMVHLFHRLEVDIHQILIMP